MTETDLPNDLTAIAREIRRSVLDMAYESKTGHVGPALSMTDILVVLYFRVMNVRPAEPSWAERDRFLLSKGHAAAAFYAVLARKGFFPADDLKRYCVDGGRFHGHPCMHAAPGIEFSSGSLGHGLSVAAGMALGLGERSGSSIFVLLGDGECNEGSVWEAAMFAATHRLRRITAIVDRNRFQGFGASDAIHAIDLKRLWESFGWRTVEVDGHRFNALEAALAEAKDSDRPTAIIADTVAGKGVRAIERMLLSHYWTPDEAAYRRAVADLYA